MQSDRWYLLHKIGYKIKAQSEVQMHILRRLPKTKNNTDEMVWINAIKTYCQDMLDMFPKMYWSFTEIIADETYTNVIRQMSFTTPDMSWESSFDISDCVEKSLLML